MPRLARKETEKRLRRMAHALCDMEQGIYQWPDGRKATLPDGSPRISKAEIVRVGGYSDYRTGKQSVWFEDPYFKRQYALERSRREMNLPQVIDKNPVNLLTLGRKMIEEALLRLEHDPDSFSTALLVNAGPQLVKIGLELEARDLQPQSTVARVDTFNAFLGDTLVEMRPEERQSVADTVSQASSERMQKLRQMVDAMQAREEEDADVIDAEVCAESS